MKKIEYKRHLHINANVKILCNNTNVYKYNTKIILSIVNNLCVYKFILNIVVKDTLFLNGNNRI